MSCLNLRLPPANKAWKRFTSKLHRLHTSKSVRKPKYRLTTNVNPSNSKPPPPPHRRHTNKPSRSQSPALSFNGSRFGRHKKFYAHKLYMHHDLVAPPPPTKNVKQDIRKICEEAISAGAADDMWESLGFASPQMHGIDERAEQFISSFRAEMELEELTATDL